MICTFTAIHHCCDVFENFQNKCIETYEPDPAQFLSAPRLSWQTVLQKTKVKPELSIDIQTKLMAEKGIIGGIFPFIHR